MATKSDYQASDGGAYERFIGRWTKRLALRVAELAPPEAEGPLLDVACGTGSMAIALIEREPSRQIVGIDVAQPYLDFAVGRAAARNIDFHKMDAQSLTFDDDSFAAAYATIALNFFADPLASAREMRRVVAPGGLVAVAGWDFRGGLVYQRMLWDTAAGIDDGARIIRDRLFSHPLAKPEGLRDLWDEAGMSGIEKQSVTIRMDFESFDDYWSPLLGGQGPVGGYVAGLSKQLQDEVREAVRLAYLSGDDDGPRSLAATAWLVVGRA